MKSKNSKIKFKNVNIKPFKKINLKIKRYNFRILNYLN